VNRQKATSSSKVQIEKQKHRRGSNMDILQALFTKMGHLANPK
jgi:hypothetical protein